MEHPTITLPAPALGNASRDLTDLLVHELAHQWWWGDEVTMRTWDDIWLNEGFATYAEVLYHERSSPSPGVLLALPGTTTGSTPASAWPLRRRALRPVPLHRSGLRQGGLGLHMLRRRVGDVVLRGRARVPEEARKRGSATRGDLRAVFEEVSGGT